MSHDVDPRSAEPQTSESGQTQTTATPTAARRTQLKRGDDLSAQQAALTPGGGGYDTQRAALQPIQGSGALAGGHVAPASGGGAPLEAGVRTTMERSLGADFSDVRVHEGAHVSSVQARAYTQGSDLHFAPGQYNPGSGSGRELIGHELTHVVQQRAGRVAMESPTTNIVQNKSLEAEADSLGSRAARGEAAPVPGGGSGGAAVQAWAIQRSGDGGAAARVGGPAQAAVHQALEGGVSDSDINSFLDSLGQVAQGAAGAGGGAAAGGNAPAPTQAKAAPGADLFGARPVDAPRLIQPAVQLSPTSGAPVQMDRTPPGRGVGMTIPGAMHLNWWQTSILLGVLNTNPMTMAFGSMLTAAVAATNAFNCTVGFGPAAGAGAGAGVSLSAGVVVAPGGILGVYGSLGAACGAIFSASVTAQATVVGGGIGNFGGGCIAFTVAGGELVVGNVSALFNTSMSFIGISAGIGVGVGSPFEVFVQYQHTWTAGGETTGTERSM